MGETIQTPADELLRANREFYRAFAAGDYVAMDRLWSEQGGATCIHPGWDALRGRERVMASWRGILKRPVPVRARAELVTRIGELGVVVCVEVLPEGELAATNVFVLEHGRWRMLHHQAGLIARSLERADDDDELDEAPADDDEPERLLN